MSLDNYYSWKLLVLSVASLILVLFVCCTPKTVIRDEVVYQTELSFMEQAALQPSEQLESFIKVHCLCNFGKFTTPECEKAAKTVLTVKARVPWHKAMMLYNAGLLKDRPVKDPPVVPETSTLCPVGVAP